MAIASHKAVGIVFTLLGAGSVGAVAVSAVGEQKSISKGVENLDSQSPQLGGILDSPLEKDDGNDPSAATEELPSTLNDDQLEDSEGEDDGKSTPYTFFFSQEREKKATVSCSETLRPEFEYWDDQGVRKIYIGCSREGQDTVVQSGVLFGPSKVTCTPSGKANTFECTSNDNKNYRFDGKWGSDKVFVKET
ncbi:hypothetical protein MHLP_01190 [Candidatus Mycoplasma haematolamae str. Purdue]|uniref:Uncharacterized protein n=1 Tax=Mycoplasma haematolamae (strain Purdue) TaxID=1212765 RepID=I7BJ11_MYCHA|nr:hypothetical protein [Candidatus Mycoplasma haematolamae]AFO51818.1 hypothetical protein MHLP_01190 [Candidatus Mycoplasma haematolamae str. Purdue]